MTVTRNGITAEEIISPLRTYYIYPSEVNGKKRYFRLEADNGKILAYDVKYGLCKKEAERWIDYDEREVEYEKRLAFCREHYDTKGAISLSDVSKDFFEVESELEDPLAYCRKIRSLTFERMEQERCEV